LRQGVPVGAAGDSAGANLAAGAAIAHRDPALRCQLLVYPMIDATCSLPSYTEFASGYGPEAGDMRRGWREYLPVGCDPRDARVSPLFAPDLGGLAPALVITAEYDTLRDEGEAFARRLAAAGTSVRLHRYDGMIHGFFTMAGALTAARRALEEAGAFLREHLRP
jgi:acetyl esterase